MGSFNTSCFVSRQTIASGDACMVVPIMQQHSYRPVQLTRDDKTEEQYGPCSSTCYPTRFWKPVGSFFEAKYDDYGRVTLTDSKVNRFRLQDFIRETLRLAPVVAAGENQCHDLPFDLHKFMGENAPDLLTYLTAKTAQERPERNDDKFFEQGTACWDYIYEVAQEQRMFWRNYSGVLRPMNFAIMHRAAYDGLVAMTNACVGWDKESYEMRSFFDRALEETKKRMAELDAEAEATTDVNEKQRKSMHKFFAFDRFREALRRVGGSESSSYPAEQSVFLGVADAYLDGKLDDDQMYGIIKPWLEIRYACSGLEALNLHFEPIVYATQDYSNEIGASYATFVGQVSAQVTRGRNVRHYGEPLNYQFSVTDPQVLKELGKAAREYDGFWELVAVRPDPDREGCSQVDFLCSLELEDLQEMLQTFSVENNDTRVLRDTLVANPVSV